MKSRATSQSPAAPWRSAAWRPYLKDVRLRGRRTHYLDVGEGPAVVLVHGVASGWAAWFSNIAELAVDYRVIAPDLPGFGRSDGLAGPVKIRDYIDVLVELLDHLGIGDVRIVGHSFGGVVAQQFASRNAERTAALVLVASGASPGVVQETMFRALAVGSAALTPFPRKLIRRAAFGAMAMAPLRQVLIGRAVHNPAIVSREMAAHMMSAACCSRGTATAILAALGAVRLQDLRPIVCPTLVVGGARDRLVTEASLKCLAVTIPGARVEMLEDVGHNVMFERAAEFNALLRSFLDDNAAA